MNNRTGEIIEKYRREKGLTQEQFAKKLGVSNTAVSKWEHGYNLPDIALLEPISKILDIDMMLLLTSENETKEATRTKNKNKKITKFLSINAFILLFLSVITIICSLLSNHYNQKINKLKSEQLQGYKFNSIDDEFAISGYIIFNKDNSLVVLEEVVYQNKTRNTDSKLYDYASIDIYNNKNRIYQSEYSLNSNSCESINDILEETLLNSKKKTKRINGFTNPYIIISIDGKNESIKKKIELELHPII
jgi:transcriptional regulator with XRE-family HTH domain